MRQGHHHQNRRNRGRSNRKGQNPLTRSFESAGPDVKIRGTPAHIAEKYMSLARDAMSSDDPVLAENYLQHAEHYNRIILAYREQQFQQGGADVVTGSLGGGRFGIPPGQDDDDIDDGEDYAPEGNGGQPAARNYDHQPNGSQSRYEGGERSDRPERSERPEREHGGRDRSHRFEDRQRRHENRPHRDRDRDRQPVVDRLPDIGFVPGSEPQPSLANGAHAEPAPAPRAERPERAERAERPERTERAEGAAPRRRRDRFGANVDQQPDFLRRPVRRRSEPAEGVEAEPAPAAVETAGDDGSRD